MRLFSLASREWMTGAAVQGAIFTAVWRSEVVAPPMMKGDVQRAAFGLLDHVDHLVERRGDQAAQADCVGAPSGRFVDERCASTMTPRSRIS